MLTLDKANKKKRISRLGLIAMLVEVRNWHPAIGLNHVDSISFKDLLVTRRQSKNETKCRPTQQ